MKLKRFSKNTSYLEKFVKHYRIKLYGALLVSTERVGLLISHESEAFQCSIAKPLTGINGKVLHHHNLVT